MHMCAYTETYRYNTDISGVTIAHRLNSILDYGKEDVYVSECVCLCMCLCVCVCEYTLGARPRATGSRLWGCCFLELRQPEPDQNTHLRQLLTDVCRNLVLSTDVCRKLVFCSDCGFRHAISISIYLLFLLGLRLPQLGKKKGLELRQLPLGQNHLF